MFSDNYSKMLTGIFGPWFDRVNKFRCMCQSIYCFPCSIQNCQTLIFGWSTFWQFNAKHTEQLALCDPVIVANSKNVYDFICSCRYEGFWECWQNGLEQKAAERVEEERISTLRYAQQRRQNLTYFVFLDIWREYRPNPFQLHAAPSSAKSNQMPANIDPNSRHYRFVGAPNRSVCHPTISNEQIKIEYSPFNEDLTEIQGIDSSLPCDRRTGSRWCSLWRIRCW